MKRIKQILKRILFPSKMKLICIPVVSFIILIFILISQKSRTMPAYLIYCMSAYSLVIWLLAVPSLTKRIKSAIISNGIIQKITATPIIGKYLNDLAFRGWYDCSDGAYKFRIHISGLYHIFVCTLYFLHNDNSSCQCSKISQIRQPYFVCCQNIEFYISYDVDSRFTDGNDISLFRKWRQLP